MKTKNTRLIVAVLLTILLGTAMLVTVFTTVGGEYMTNGKRRIEIAGGTYSGEPYTLSIETNRARTSYVCAKWTLDKEDIGYITGFLVKNEKGEVIRAAAGGWASFEFVPDKLEKGVYTAEFHVLASEEEYEAFCGKYIPDSNIPSEEYEPYDGYHDGVWEESFEFRLVPYVKPAVIFIMLCGIGLGLALAAIIVMICSKTGRIKSEYDERQIQAQGKGFKYGFFTSLAVMFILFFACSVEVNIPLNKSLCAFIPVFAGGCVSVIYIIWKEAYFGLDTRVRPLIIALGTIAVILAGLIVILGKNGLFISNGVLTFNSSVIFIEVMIVAMFITLVAKAVSLKRSEE